MTIDICPVCGFLRGEGHVCQSPDETPADDSNIEIAKPYISAPAPYADPDSDDLIVPDVVGEVIGWRVWRVLNPRDPEEIRLQSLGAGGPRHASVWSPGKVMEAYCMGNHTSPSEHCACGFYAAKSKEHLLSMHYHSGFDYDDPDEVLVLGEVAMQGKIIPGTQGWRAQRVRPLRVSVLPSRWKVVPLLKKKYPDVEFKLENFLSKPKGGGDNR